MKHHIALVFLMNILLMPFVLAEPLSVGADDDIASVLAAHSGKRVTLHLASGTELTGILGTVNARVAHLQQLSGREYFDGVVAIKKIQAVIIRVKK